MRRTDEKCMQGSVRRAARQEHFEGLCVYGR